MADDGIAPLVFVTGAAGWLGWRLAETLVSGLPDDERFRSPPPERRVRAFIMKFQDAMLPARRSSRIELEAGDLRNLEDCRNFLRDARGATVLHTAGIIHPRRVRDFYDVNVLGTKNLLAAAEAVGVKRVVVVSSNSPIGCNPSPTHLFDEDAPYNPYMHYGRSKMVMEQAVRQVQERGKLETIIVRPPWFYGPYQPPRQTLFFEMIRGGKAPIVEDGNNRRSMCYIDNLCQGLMLAATVAQANGRTYWIADERPYTMNEILDTVERLMEKEFGMPCAHKRLRLPSVASEVAWWFDRTLQGLGMYHQKIHVLSEMNKTIACSIERAKRELGYQPAIALEEGMRRSLAWCLEHGLLQRSVAS